MKRKCEALPLKGAIGIGSNKLAPATQEGDQLTTATRLSEANKHGVYVKNVEVFEFPYPRSVRAHLKITIARREDGYCYGLHADENVTPAHRGFGWGPSVRDDAFPNTTAAKVAAVDYVIDAYERGTKEHGGEKLVKLLKILMEWKRRNGDDQLTLF